MRKNKESKRYNRSGPTNKLYHRAANNTCGIQIEEGLLDHLKAIAQNPEP